MFFENHRIQVRAEAAAKAAICAVVLLALTTAQAQSFHVLHAFTGQGDGYTPFAGLTLDSGGNLYGTTSEYPLGGTVFKMKPVNGSWVFNTLLNFDGQNGLLPYSRVVFGPGGSMFGTTLEGGSSLNCQFGCGTVYNLHPPQTVCEAVSCPWMDRAIVSFGDDQNGGDPYFVDPVFDSAGNLYGTSFHGGGLVFQLTRSGSDWSETLVHRFSGPDGSYPFSGVILDRAGNLYGVASRGGGHSFGSVYRLSPSDSGWTLTTLYSFAGFSDGQYPESALIMDGAGNLYGATATGGDNGGGTVFQLSPSGGNFVFTLIYALAGQETHNSVPGPVNALAMDAAGNLYGSAILDGAFGYGSIFKLIPSGGSWSYLSLHDFTNGDDGAYPIGGVAVDGNGNVYGTNAGGGLQNQTCTYGPGCGVVWEITP